MEFNDEGTKNSGELVSVGGKLPLLRELRTSQLLDFFVALSANKEKNLRKRINQWLYPKTRPGFYMEIKPNLHLAYADQRDGHGTQHWWRLFFDEHWQERIEQIVRGSAIVVGRSNNGTTEWGGMMFRSPVEVKIAEALDRRGLLFFGNARGRIGGQGSPLSASTLTGRLEIDFLVFHRTKITTTDR